MVPEGVGMRTSRGLRDPGGGPWPSCYSTPEHAAKPKAELQENDRASMEKMAAEKAEKDRIEAEKAAEAAVKSDELVRLNKERTTTKRKRPQCGRSRRTLG